MKLETFHYLSGQPWSAASLPALDSPQTLVLLFGARELLEDPAPLEAIARAYPTSHLIGCSTAGEIWGAALYDHSICGAVLRFEHTQLRSAAAFVSTSEASHSAGVSLARELASPDLRAVFVLSDGQSVNGSDLIVGLNSVLPDSVVVTGGLAGDGDRFEKTWVLNAGRPQSGVVSAVGLYGEQVRVWHGSKGGWDIFGPERRVTRSRGNLLYELDGRPALDLYKSYLGDRASGLPATALLFPLALRSSPDDDKTVVRTILAVDEAEQSMRFAGDIPEGSLAQLMRANFDRLIDGATDAATMAQAAATPQPLLSVAISCVGRRLVLGERTEEELEAALQVLPPGTQQIGFYSYGEISPYAVGYCDLHNQTMTITTIGEASDLSRAG